VLQNVNLQTIRKYINIISHFRDITSEMQRQRDGRRLMDAVEVNDVNITEQANQQTEEARETYRTKAKHVNDTGGSRAR